MAPLIGRRLVVALLVYTQCYTLCENQHINHVHLSEIPAPIRNNTSHTDALHLFLAEKRAALA